MRCFSSWFLGICLGWFLDVFSWFTNGFRMFSWFYIDAFQTKIVFRCFPAGLSEPELFGGLQCCPWQVNLAAFWSTGQSESGFSVIFM